jgi:hypothetical protein
VGGQSGDRGQALTRYQPAVDGEWITPARRGYRMRCCDCGLVHVIDFRLRPTLNGGRKLQYRATRDRRATAGSRHRTAEQLEHLWWTLLKTSMTKRESRQMPLTSKGSKIMKNMKKQYGEKKGESVFYGARNKGTIKGVEPPSRQRASAPKPAKKAKSKRTSTPERRSLARRFPDNTPA